jgi:hypothetical protein
MAKKQVIDRPVEEQNCSIIDIDVKDLTPHVIDGYLVSISDGHHTIGLPTNATGVQFRSWYRGRGGIFSKDVLAKIFNREYGKYVILKSNELKCIARLIDDEEELSFKTMKLVDGYIKDRPYMILKHLDNDDSIRSTYRYILEKDIEIDDEIHIPVPPQISHDEDEIEQSHHGSISLFTE